MTTSNPRARIAGIFYLLCIVTGIPGEILRDKLVIANDAAATATNILAHESVLHAAFASTLMATVAYVVVTALFYFLFRPVDQTFSMVAALFSLVGCAVSAVSGLFLLAPLSVLKGTVLASAFSPEQVQSLAYLMLRLRDQGSTVGILFFGFYCITIGYLILRSRFLPRALGVLMVISGLGWLTFFWPPLSRALYPYNVFVSGLLGEGALTLWLLIMGVNVPRWREQAAAN